MIEQCGCQNEVDMALQMVKCVKKCPRHQEINKREEDATEVYYRTLFDVGQPTNHVAELEEALGPVPMRLSVRGKVLEVGAGASPYVRMLQARGYSYEAVERSQWACEWLNKQEGVTADCSPWETYIPQKQYHVILCAHALEHMADPLPALRKMRHALLPGGLLYVVVPDDTDLRNPGHLWFFRPSDLNRVAELAGFKVEKLEVRRIVPQENFIYMRARRP